MLLTKGLSKEAHYYYGFRNLPIPQPLRSRPEGRLIERAAPNCQRLATAGGLMLNSGVKAQSGNSTFTLEELHGGNFRLSLRRSRPTTLSRDELTAIRNAISRALE